MCAMPQQSRSCDMSGTCEEMHVQHQQGKPLSRAPEPPVSEKPAVVTVPDPIEADLKAMGWGASPPAVQEAPKRKLQDLTRENIKQALQGATSSGPPILAACGGNVRLARDLQQDQPPEEQPWPVGEMLGEIEGAPLLRGQTEVSAADGVVWWRFQCCGSALEVRGEDLRRATCHEPASPLDRATGSDCGAEAC